MKVIVEIKNCADCQYLEHNGMLQEYPKYYCNHNDAKGLVGYKHWNSHPVIFVYDKYKQPIINTNDAFKIPNWCPLRKNEIK